MTEKRPTLKPIDPSKPILVFEVSRGGTLRLADFTEAQTRAEFYEYVYDFWSRSSMDLVQAMSECQPLTWAVQSIYSDYRAELEAELQDERGLDGGDEQKLADLEKRLKSLPEEPEDGVIAWLQCLNGKEFEQIVVPEIEKWFGEPPNWSFEDDFLPERCTAQGAALEFFRELSAEEIETLGIDIVEGEYPGSTYYAAELRGNVDEANSAAELSGIPVRFVPGMD